jgi:hypothetical protein
MIQYNVIFNTTGDPDFQFVGTIKQYSNDQFRLKVYLPDSFDTGFTISANIKRADDEIGSYVLAFSTDHWVLDFVPFTTLISGELQVTIQAVDGSANVFVFKTVTLNVEETVAPSDFDPAVDSPEYTTIIASLATKQPLDGDLTSIAALTGTGHLQRTGANTYVLNDMANFATLDSGGKVPANQLPSYVDDVIEGIYVNSTTFTVGGEPIVLETGKIYVSTNTHLTYRYSGSELIQLGTVAETDPVFTASNAFSITGTDKTNWNEAYSWGNHANAGYASNTAITNAGNWDTAFGWGNHANAGYLINSSQVITDLGNTTSTLTSNLGNLTNSVSDLSNTVSTINGSYLTASSTTITDIVNTANQTTTDLSNLTNVVANKVNTSLLGQVNGVATLDEAGKVPSSQLPSFVDDVLEYANLAGFPETGESGKIYIAIDTGLTYRWSGTIYAEISQSLALGNTSSTAFRGDLGKEAYDWGNHANGGYALNTAIANASNWDTAFGWGNHANAGYLTAEADTLDTVATRGNTTNSATINFVSSNQTNYNTNGTNGYLTGQVGWNADVGTLDIGLYNGTVLHSGQQTLYWVKADETITVGDVVQFNGVAGFTPKVKKAVPSEINNNPSLLMGIASGNIADEANGYVTTFGMLRNVTTTGLSLGDILFYNSNTNASAGTLTTTQPEAPNAKIQLAAVVRLATGEASNGELLVRVQTPVSISDDSSVQLTNLANGEVLAYNGTSARWENKEVVSLGLNVALTNIANDQYLAYDNGVWINRDLIVYGTVNSVGINTTTTALTVNGTVTNSGNLSVDVASGYIIPTTANSDNYNAAFGWGNHQAVGYVVGSLSPTVTADNIAVYNGTTGLLIKDGGVPISSVGNVVGAGTVVSGNVATFNGTTGAILGAGYTVETSITNVATALPTSSAVTTYVDAQIGDIETILDDIIG